MPTDTASLTLSRAAELLGWEGPNRAQRLRRMLLQREAEQQRLIMTRRGSRKRWVYRVTMARLKECCPELFGVPERNASSVTAFRRHLSTIDRRLDERDARLEQQIHHVLHHSEETRSMLCELSERVARSVSENTAVKKTENSLQASDTIQEKRGWLD
jgi:hypothetical protein